MKQDITMKESQHGKEVNQLKSDMLVAIQVARSGSSSPVQHHSDDESKDTITSVGLKLSLEVSNFIFVKTHGLDGFFFTQFGAPSILKTKDPIG